MRLLSAIPCPAEILAAHLDPQKMSAAHLKLQLRKIRLVVAGSQTLA